MAKKQRKLSKTTKEMALIISMYIRNSMDDFHIKHLTDSQMAELNPIIRNAVVTALYAIRNYSKDKACTKLVNFQLMMIPEYWEEPQLTEEFKRFAKSLELEISDRLEQKEGDS